MKNRCELREIIMKVIYQVLILRDSSFDVEVKKLIEEQLDFESTYVNLTISGILEHEESIRDLANKYLDNWEMDRLNKVDQAIILLGIYELMYNKKVPSIVAINESIELSKKYSDEKVTKMINAVLDKIYKNEV